MTSRAPQNNPEAKEGGCTSRPCLQMRQRKLVNGLGYASRLPPVFITHPRTYNISTHAAVGICAFFALGPSLTVALNIIPVTSKFLLFLSVVIFYPFIPHTLCFSILVGKKYSDSPILLYHGLCFLSLHVSLITYHNPLCNLSMPPPHHPDIPHSVYWVSLLLSQPTALQHPKLDLPGALSAEEVTKAFSRLSNECSPRNT